MPKRCNVLLETVKELPPLQVLKIKGDGLCHDRTVSRRLWSGLSVAHGDQRLQAASVVWVKAEALAFQMDWLERRLRLKALRAQRQEWYDLSRHHRLGDDVLRKQDLSEAFRVNGDGTRQCSACAFAGVSVVRSLFWVGFAHDLPVQHADSGVDAHFPILCRQLVRDWVVHDRILVITAPKMVAATKRRQDVKVCVFLGPPIVGVIKFVNLGFVPGNVGFWMLLLVQQTQRMTELMQYGCFEFRVVHFNIQIQRRLMLFI